MACTTAELNIDLSALLHNYAALRARAGGAEVAAVVKADAYGLGMADIAPVLAENGAKTFFVARADEGFSLRRIVGAGPVIYVLDGGGTSLETLLASDLRPVINSVEGCRAWVDRKGGDAALHVDTGMNRLGIRPEETRAIPWPFIERMTLVMSHLACSDDVTNPMNGEQLNRFKSVAAAFSRVPSSLANSGGVFLGADFAFDMVRPGISLYGGGPQGVPHPELRPVACLRARIVQVRNLPKGESVGYGQTFMANEPRTIATVGIGYADGIPRSFSQSGQVMVNGLPCPLTGRVSMDVLSVDVTDQSVKVGDWVEIFGAHQTLDDMALQANTISYEILTRLGRRLTRRYTLPD